MPINIYTSSDIYNYRNKLTLFINNQNIGLKKRKSNSVVNIEKCLIARDKINIALLKVKNFISENNLEKNIEKLFLDKKINIV